MDTKEKGIIFLSAVCTVLALIVIAQSSEIDEKANQFAVKRLCEINGLEYKSSRYDVKKKLFRVECQNVTEKEQENN